jgi:hypothetical protein
MRRIWRLATLILSVLGTFAVSGLATAQSIEATGHADMSANKELVTSCSDGAVNGLITVSIAATVALFAEVALPAYPILFAVGIGVGCPVRVIGKHAETYALSTFYGP